MSINDQIYFKYDTTKDRWDFMLNTSLNGNLFCVVAVSSHLWNDGHNRQCDNRWCWVIFQDAQKFYSLSTEN